MRSSTEKPLTRVTAFQTIGWILTDLCAENGFDAALLVGSEGLPLASSRAGDEAEAQAAATDFLRRSAQQAMAQLGWSGLDELRLIITDGRRLVVRPFELEEERVFLVVLLPRALAYRQVMDQAIGFIQYTWKAHKVHVDITDF